MISWLLSVAGAIITLAGVLVAVFAPIDTRHEGAVHLTYSILLAVGLVLFSQGLIGAVTGVTP